MDFQSEKCFGKLRLRAFKPYHQMLCMLKHVEDVKWQKNIQTHFYHTFLNMVSFECNPMYVEDVEDRSNTPKAVMLCMLKHVEDGKRTYTHILAHNFLNT